MDSHGGPLLIGRKEQLVSPLLVRNPIRRGSALRLELHGGSHQRLAVESHPAGDIAELFSAAAGRQGNRQKHHSGAGKLIPRR
jgi:hypothetical protein